MPITPYTLWQAFWIMAGLWVDSKLAWMCIYEWRNPGDGEKYLRGELCHLKTKKKETYISKIISKLIPNSTKNIKKDVVNISEIKEQGELIQIFHQWMKESNLKFKD